MNDDRAGDEVSDAAAVLVEDHAHHTGAVEARQKVHDAKQVTDDG